MLNMTNCMRLAGEVIIFASRSSAFPTKHRDRHPYESRSKQLPRFLEMSPSVKATCHLHSHALTPSPGYTPLYVAAYRRHWVTARLVLAIATAQHDPSLSAAPVNVKDLMQCLSSII